MLDREAREILVDRLLSMPCGERFDFSELVRLCESLDLPLFEAAYLLDSLVVDGALCREYLDEQGRAVDPARIDAMLAGARWGYCPRCHVAWRRTAGRAWMLA